CVFAPEAHQEQGAHALRTLPHLFEAGACLLTQLLGVGQPQDNAARKSLRRCVVTAREPVADAVHGDASLAGTRGKSDDGAFAGVAQRVTKLRLDLVLKRLQRAEPKAAFQVFEIGKSLLGWESG